MMPNDRALLFCSNHPPLYVKLRPYYLVRRLKQLSELPTPQLTGNAVRGPVPLIPLFTFQS